jgi:hypothetical protein
LLLNDDSTNNDFARALKQHKRITVVTKDETLDSSVPTEEEIAAEAKETAEAK